MARFLDLPPELLPRIFSFVLNPKHIFSFCLVSKSFNQFATPWLYRYVSIFAWYKDAKHKVVALFQTLSRCPHLARHVEKLEIRDFPKALVNSQSDLLRICAQGVGNCINLRSCVWTRDGTLHSPILASLCGCPLLHELEINGNAGYSPDLLTKFSRLSRISLVMPNAKILDILPTWISITGNTLRSLTILCKTSTLVTDTFLSQIASNLRQLEYLSIIGCPRVTHVGIGAIASASENGLVGINIEGLSQTFDMFAFKVTCLRAQAFRRLKAITLTVRAHVTLADWSRDVCDLLSSAPLEAFSMYSMLSTSTWASVPSDFWKGIVEKHGQRLKKFSIHRIRIGLAALEMICSQCPLLEQLFIVVEQHELDHAACLFALARNLRVLHVNFPLKAGEPLAVSPRLLMEKAVSIVSACSPTLVHIGCNMRVWQIKKTVQLDENGEKYVTPTLAPPESLVVPEQFLVVRA